MKTSEFDEWFSHHVRCVGGFADWLSRGRDETEQARVLAVWRQALTDVSFDDAKAASMAIMRGDLDVKAFGDHPKKIIRFAKERRSETLNVKKRRFIGVQEVFDCPKCLDSGVRLCYHPIAINEVLKRRLECVVEVNRHQSGDAKHARRTMPKMYTCCYACDCDEGRERQSRKMTAFDESRCLLVGAARSADQIDELFRLVDERVLRGVRARPNYEHSFDDFNSAPVNAELGF